ncbi:hypothetical protein I3843_09G169600 [Carya illinoinensis]|nr:hypothetical protein I3843_09G169600 [Carya illinoinensis]
MKQLVALFLVVLVVGTSSCLAVPRRAMSSGAYRQEKRYQAQKGMAVEGGREESKIQYADGNIDNHHNIPRQYYNDWGGTSQGDNGNGNKDGSG